MAVVIAVCAFAGALAGIAGTAAAPSKSNSPKKAAKQQAHALRHAFRGRFRAGGFLGRGFLGGGPVHEELVVPKSDGSGFVTITTDAGTLNSVDGTTVHVKEGTDKNTYKSDAAIDVGSDAKVIRNRADAKLSDLKQGDHVRVITGAPGGNLVIAADDALLQQRQKDRGRWDHRGFAPGGPPPGAPGGPPPGAPGGLPPGAPDNPANPPGSSQNGSNS
jgi:type II secretory pathway pseudopilin PulG